MIIFSLKGAAFAIALLPLQKQRKAKEDLNTNNVKLFLFNL
jgi:hypothetical protein